MASFKLGFVARCRILRRFRRVGRLPVAKSGRIAIRPSTDGFSNRPYQIARTCPDVLHRDGAPRKPNGWATSQSLRQLRYTNRQYSARGYNRESSMTGIHPARLESKRRVPQPSAVLKGGAGFAFDQEITCPTLAQNARTGHPGNRIDGPPANYVRANSL
jgi:hypothetical protein